MQSKTQRPNAFGTKPHCRGQYQIGPVWFQQVNRTHFRAESLRDQGDNIHQRLCRFAAAPREIRDFFKRQNVALFPRLRRGYPRSLALCPLYAHVLWPHLLSLSRMLFRHRTAHKTLVSCPSISPIEIVNRAYNPRAVPYRSRFAIFLLGNYNLQTSMPRTVLNYTRKWRGTIRAPRNR